MMSCKQGADTMRDRAGSPSGEDGRPAPPSEIGILGSCTINGRSVGCIKVVELVTALAVAGGRMHRTPLQRRLYEQDIAESTLPTLAYRARRLGIDVRFDRGGRQFRLYPVPEIDALHVFALVRSQKVAEALALYRGPCLPTSHSPIAEALRYSLESCLADAVIRSADRKLIRSAARRIETWSFAEHTLRGDDPISMVLGHSYLGGYGLLSGE